MKILTAAVRWVQKLNVVQLLIVAAVLLTLSWWLWNKRTTRLAELDGLINVYVDNATSPIVPTPQPTEAFMRDLAARGIDTTVLSQTPEARERRQQRRLDSIGELMTERSEVASRLGISCGAAVGVLLTILWLWSARPDDRKGV